MNKTKEQFIPRDKPKSWVLGILSVLVGLLVVSPIIFIGAYFNFKFIQYISMGLFVLFWLTFAISWLVFGIGLFGGKYRNLQKQEWSKQLW